MAVFHLKREYDIPVFSHSSLKWDTAPIPAIILGGRGVAIKRDMGFIWIRDVHFRLAQDVPQTRAFPLAVHDGAIAPIDAIHLLELRAHSMASVSGTLQGTDDFKLREVGAKLRG